MKRRDFVLTTLAAAASASWMKPVLAADTKTKEATKNVFSAFIKPLQSLSYDELGDTIANLGFDGIEATVRKGGYITPENANDELPKLVETLKKYGLKIYIITSDIVAADQPNAESLLRTAAELEIQRYRMGFYRYNLKKPILPQLESLAPKVRDLAALSKEVGITAIYQNHCGANFVGATFWDLHSLIKDYPVDQMSSIFDIRHALVEGGKAWPVYLNLMKPHISAYSVKDFTWKGNADAHVPLGEGNVDPQFFKSLTKSGYRGLFTVHVEYLTNGSVKANVDALGKDLKTLKGFLGEG